VGPGCRGLHLLSGNLIPGWTEKVRTQKLNRCLH